MLCITARNVNNAYAEGLWKMRILGAGADSRNGKVMRISGPVATTYTHPQERMLFNAKRDANPFFHIFESIWMLTGRNDVAWLSQFNSNIGRYSDDGSTFAGAYGWRWRRHFTYDQVKWVIEHLRNFPDSRRAVVQMYNPDVDHPATNRGGSDIPCNTAVYFGIEDECLNMTVTCRSNDMIWGAYGANAVHMSMLQEFVARAVGVNVGRYVQFSNDFHMYETHYELLDHVEASWDYTDEMVNGHIPITEASRWRADLSQFEEWIDYPYDTYDSQYIDQVLSPMHMAWEAYKAKDAVLAISAAVAIKDKAVSTACVAWLRRRKWA